MGNGRRVDGRPKAARLLIFVLSGNEYAAVTFEKVSRALNDARVQKCTPERYRTR
jgi:hypothetical protein